MASQHLQSIVCQIKAELEFSRFGLDLVERKTKDSIGDEINEMREAILRGDKRTQHSVSELQSFLKSIKYESAESIDLTPQMQWLGLKLDSIVKEFTSAELSADNAQMCAADSVGLILDASVEVHNQEARLKVARQQGEKLVADAKAQLSESKDGLQRARGGLSRTQDAIRENERAAAEITASKNSTESWIQEMRGAIQEAESHVRRAKKKSKIVGWTSAAIAVGFAPLTGGGSLALLGVSAGYGIGTALNVSDARDQIRDAQVKVREEETSLSNYKNAITSLKNDQKEWEEVRQNYQSTLEMRQEMQKHYEAEIDQADSMQQEISLLQNTATSLKSNFQEAKKDLETVKKGIEDYSIKLQEYSSTIKTESSKPGFFLLGNARRSHFEKQKRLLSQACDTLENMHTQVPALLKGQDTRFLAFDTWDSDEEVSVGREAPIPQTARRT